jgi:hypothetical protein
MPAYRFEEFVAACAGDPKGIYVRGEAMADAEKEFHLRTKEEILRFISNDGLENPKHRNTVPLEKNPEHPTPIDVDAYDFSSGKKTGYIAFYFRPGKKQWTIKSFKQSFSSPLLDNPFKVLEGLVVGTDRSEEKKNER